MKNGGHAIGLFQGMFDKNILTFNPGWNSDAQPLEEFTDVRKLQRQLKSLGVNMISEADENTTGPASFMIVDPDGNTILVDQHVWGDLDLLRRRCLSGKRRTPGVYERCAS